MNEVRETCENCKHYSYVLLDPFGFTHVHDYCNIWKTQIPSCVVFTKMGFEKGANDIESGITRCFAFEEKDEDLIYIFPELGGEV